MPLVTVRHFTEADIALRCELLRESHFQANLTDFAVTTGDDALAAGMRRTVREDQSIKRMYTVCGAKGQIFGFGWVTSIDWRAQCCELSFGVLPRYRGAFGATAVGALHEYVHVELNMKVLINQVLEHNTMLISADDLAEHRDVRCAYDSYTVGQWRTACYWTKLVEDPLRFGEAHQERRRAIAEQIRENARGAT
jgi:hypothetical protein